jgi:peptide-methionine (S)-S-oxide reductase
MHVATFGAGCFWGVEATFRKLPGVKDTTVGYSGGHLPNPSYEQVCTDRTGHAEVVRVEYEPAEISYEQLLDVFFANHDPTTLNRQGPDSGSQYRSTIFYHSEAQRAAAQAAKERLQQSGTHRRPVVTAIEPAREFYRAEEYHQQYLQKHGQASCHI